MTETCIAVYVNGKLSSLQKIPKKARVQVRVEEREEEQMPIIDRKKILFALTVYDSKEK